MEESDLSTTDPASPESGSAAASVHAGDGAAESDLGHPSPAAGTDGTFVLKLSELKKLMNAVEAAILLYNACENDRLGHDMTWADEFDALGHALDQLEVPKS